MNFASEIPGKLFDLKAKVLMPVHWEKFRLGMHPWNEPVKRVVAKAQDVNIKGVTPRIGQPVLFSDTHAADEWWDM